MRQITGSELTQYRFCRGFSTGSAGAFSLYSRKILGTDYTVGLVRLINLIIQAEFDKVKIVTQEEDRNFFKMLFVIIGALAVFFVLSIIIARVVSSGNTGESGTDKMVESAIVQRIKPFGGVNIGSAPVATASASVDGKGIYTSACAMCHASGAAGAPKVGDKAAWKARIAKGMSQLNESGINGVPGTAMSAKGGNSSLSDAAVKAAVEYMVKGSK